MHCKAAAPPVRHPQSLPQTNMPNRFKSHWDESKVTDLHYEDHGTSEEFTLRAGLASHPHHQETVTSQASRFHYVAGRDPRVYSTTVTRPLCCATGSCSHPSCNISHCGFVYDKLMIHRPPPEATIYHEAASADRSVNNPDCQQRTARRIRAVLMHRTPATSRPAQLRFLSTDTGLRYQHLTFGNPFVAAHHAQPDGNRGNRAI
jgi:hypothetical protein